MARFEVYANRGANRHVAPYLVDVQSEFLEGLTTTVVVPLIREEEHPGKRLPRDLVPGFEISGIRCVFYPPFIGAITTRELGEHVASLREEGNSLIAALDRLTRGF